MTNAEAIKVLEQIRQWTDYSKEALTMAIEALSQPFLPSNLEEAAEECRWKIEEHCVIDDRGDSLYSECDVEDAFKAGAEWMAEQGETHNEMVYAFTGDGSTRYISGIFLSPSNFNLADKVTVQIRKK